MIYLLRHGEIDSGGEKRFIGQTDPPLTAKGLRQAQAWRDHFSDTVFEKIYCSDLRRACKTAEIIAENRGTAIRRMSALREIHLGEFESLSMAEVKKRFPEKWRDRGENIYVFRPTGGESFSDLCDRVFPVFETIAAETTESTLIVGHAGVNRVILCRILGIPPGNLFRIGQDYAGLNTIDCQTPPYRVVSMNIPWSADSLQRLADG